MQVDSHDEQLAPAPPAAVDLVVLCTGNAARSVMAGVMLEVLAEAEGIGLRVTTAGTHAVEGQPASHRTRAALGTVEALGDVTLSAHRSRQLGAANLSSADLVVAMEADHVRYVRRLHPDAADRTATIRRLCADLHPGPASLASRVASLDLDQVLLSEDEDVTDPAGGDDEDYAACAAELWTLCQELLTRL
jgi:protein-tyrosine phosphatase